MQLMDAKVVGTAKPAQLFRVAPSELKLGHKIVRLDRAWAESPFSGPTLILETFEQRRLLGEVCEWVVIDVSWGAVTVRPRGLKVEPLHETLPALPQRVDLLQRSRLTPESMKAALSIYWTLSRRTAEFLNSFRSTGQLDMHMALSITTVLAKAQKVSMAALIWLTRIKDRRYYHAQHCVNSSILMAGFVHALNWDQERVETAALIGLLHDLGKSRLDPALLHKAGSLSPEELEEIQMHPVLGYELLKRNPDVAWEVTAAIHASHERPDGSGYPRGLSADEIPLMARIIAIVDAYDAMTSERDHVPPVSHQQALGALWKERDRQFDQRLVEAFIQFMGWIPPGALVRLSDGRLAVEIGMDVSDAVRPRVRPIIGKPERFELGPEILLQPQFGGDAGSPLRIAELLPDNAEGFSMRELTRKLFQALDMSSKAGPEAAVAAQQLAPASPLVAAPPPSAAAAPAELRSAVGPAVRPAAPSTLEPKPEPKPELKPASVPESQPEASQPAALAAAPSLSGRFAGRQCLVVDDSQTVRKTLVKLLEREGFSVRAVVSGEEALQELAQEPAHIIFLDILLPGMSGFSVLRELRRAKLVQNMAVVMISGNPEATEQFFLGRIGADDFLPKPFGEADVEACLGRLLRSQRLQAPASPGELN